MRIESEVRGEVSALEQTCWLEMLQSIVHVLTGVCALMLDPLVQRLAPNHHCKQRFGFCQLADHHCKQRSGFPSLS